MANGNLSVAVTGIMSLNFANVNTALKNNDYNCKSFIATALLPLANLVGVAEIGSFQFYVTLTKAAKASTVFPSLLLALPY